MSARITNTRIADQNHVVHTVEGGADTYRRKPCSDCPWRRDAAGVFPAEAFMHSANTGTDGAHFNADAHHIFACHQSGAEKPAICAGYILGGSDAVGWRVAVIEGRFNPRNVDAGGCDIFGSYYEMAVANGVPPDAPAIQCCRPWRLARP